MRPGQVRGPLDHHLERLIRRKVSKEFFPGPGRRREALVDAEPDQDARQDDEVAASDDEALQVERRPGGIARSDACTEVENAHGDGRDRRLAPAPANCRREDQEDAENEERARIAVRCKHQHREDGDVQDVRQCREPGIRPPVVPGQLRDRRAVLGGMAQYLLDEGLGGRDPRLEIEVAVGLGQDRDLLHSPAPRPRDVDS